MRVIPYAPVALIGIEASAGHPKTDPNDGEVRHVPQDYLAIPHEIGHYVFWRGKSANGQRIHDSFRGGDVPQELEWCERWIEEIFADVLGCWLGGPVMALAAQEMQRTYRQDRFTADDGEHPVPALRPNIYTKVLDHLSDPLAEELHERWVTYLRDYRPGSNRFKVDGGGSVSVDEAISPGVAIDPTEPVDAVIEASLQRLQELTINGNEWRSYLTSGLQIDDLFGAFESSNLFTLDSVPPLVPIDTSSLWNTWVDGVVGLVSTGFNFSTLNQGDEIPSAVWKAILLASGWTTRFARSWKRARPLARSWK